MSNSTQMDRVLDGMLNFNAETKETLDSIKETIDKVFDKHYQANHTPYAVMKFEDEYHYWEEQLAEAINRIEYSDYDVLEPKGVEMLQRRSYVIIRGELKSGNTIHFDNTKFNQLYINGEYYTGDYTFNGETPETYERLVVVVVQTPFNLGIKDYGNLEMTVADFPIENAEIFANVGTYSNLQPNIDELLMTDTADSLYVRGDWILNSSFYSPIKVFSVTNIFNTNGYAWDWSNIRDLFLPNTVNIYSKNQTGTYRNIDISNATGTISQPAFSGAKIKGTLKIPKISYINSSAFTNCFQIEYVELGNTLTSLGDIAFGNCKILKEIKIPDTVVDIGASAFADCSLLKKAYIGNNVLRLLYNTFRSCGALEEIILGKSIIDINSNTFYGCVSLKTIKVNKGYHCPTTPITQSNVLDWHCFLDVLKNCAVNGEDGRTAATMIFRVSSVVRTQLTNAYNEGDETALAIYELMDSKNISITT